MMLLQLSRAAGDFPRVVLGRQRGHDRRPLGRPDHVAEDKPVELVDLDTEAIEPPIALIHPSISTVGSVCWNLERTQA